MRLHLARHNGLRQPADLAGTAARGVGHGGVDIALPADLQFLDLALRLKAAQGLEHGFAQGQAACQLADDANVPIIALDLAAARGGAFRIVNVHLQIASGPAQAVMRFKPQSFGCQGVAVAHIALVEAQLECALQPFQRQRRQVFAQGHVYRLQLRADRYAATQPFAVFGLHMQLAFALPHGNVFAQVCVLAQARNVCFGNIGLHGARPFVPLGRFAPQPVLPIGCRLDRLAPAGRGGECQLQIVVPAVVIQAGLHLRNHQGHYLPLRIAPLHAPVANFKHRLLQQPIQRRIG